MTRGWKADWKRAAKGAVKGLKGVRREVEGSLKGDWKRLGVVGQILRKVGELGSLESLDKSCVTKKMNGTSVRMGGASRRT